MMIPTTVSRRSMLRVLASAASAFALEGCASLAGTAARLDAAGPTTNAARLSNGIRFRGETMVFSWPSKAQLFDYGYDRESAMWSRDALEQVLSGLITSPAVGRVHIVAHSVGTMLTMEAIRQIYDRHGG